MKQQKGFDWFKFVMTAMFVIGIGFCLFSVFCGSFFVSLYQQILLRLI